MGFELKNYYTKQSSPLMGCRIDYNNKLTDRLIGCWLFNESGGKKINDLVSRKVGTLSNGLSDTDWKSCIFGAKIKFSGTANERILLGAEVHYKPPIPFTIMCFSVIDSLAAKRPIFANENSATTYAGVDLTVSATGGVELRLGDNDGTIGASSRRSANISNAVRVDIPFVLIATCREITDSSMWVNGKSYPVTYSGTGSGLVYQSGAGGNVKIGETQNTDAPNVGYMSGFHNLIYFWEREIFPDEANQLSINPYSFIYPTFNPIFNSTDTATTVFRRTLSGLGTRTGSRQVVGV